jgi:hypothetical protein
MKHSVDLSDAALISGGGRNIVVQTEKIGRVVLVLQRHQPLVVAAVRRLHAGCAIIRIEVVDIHPLRERFYGFPEGTRPADVLFRLRRVRPLREDIDVPLILTMGKGRLIRLYPRCHPMQMEKEAHRERRGFACCVVKDGIDQAVLQVLEVPRFPGARNRLSSGVAGVAGRWLGLLT